METTQVIDARKLEEKVVSYLDSIDVLEQIFRVFEAMERAGAPQSELEIAIMAVLSARHEDLKKQDPHFEQQYENAFLFRMLQKIYPKLRHDKKANV
jgi:hypothetical protein